jgi:hypothetical protein
MYGNAAVPARSNSTFPADLPQSVRASMFPAVWECETRFTLFTGSVRSLSLMGNVFGGIVTAGPGDFRPDGYSQRGGFPRPI